MSNYDEEEIPATELPAAVIVDESEDQVDPYFDPDSDLNDFTFEEDLSLRENEEE